MAEHIGDQLRGERRSAGIRAVELALFLHVQPGRIREIEQAWRPSERSIERYRAALHWAILAHEIAERDAPP